jgi:hypothetical protein
MADRDSSVAIVLGPEMRLEEVSSARADPAHGKNIRSANTQITGRMKNPAFASVAFIQIHFLPSVPSIIRQKKVALHAAHKHFPSPSRLTPSPSSSMVIGNPVHTKEGQQGHLE